MTSMFCSCFLTHFLPDKALPMYLGLRSTVRVHTGLGFPVVYTLCTTNIYHTFIESFNAIQHLFSAIQTLYRCLELYTCRFFFFNQAKLPRVFSEILPCLPSVAYKQCKLQREGSSGLCFWNDR